MPRVERPIPCWSLRVPAGASWGEAYLESVATQLSCARAGSGILLEESGQDPGRLRLFPSPPGIERCLLDACQRLPVRLEREWAVETDAGAEPSSSLVFGLLPGRDAPRQPPVVGEPLDPRHRSGPPASAVSSGLFPCLPEAPTWEALPAEVELRSYWFPDERGGLRAWLRLRGPGPEAAWPIRSRLARVGFPEVALRRLPSHRTFRRWAT
ncbi:MAG TPA: hypothetical protein VJS68_01630, partial [Thermoplasmata archaeon]|nr:hypothetical protein [Thermoplasmata archaeon]